MELRLDTRRLKPENKNYDFNILTNRDYEWLNELSDLEFSDIIYDRISAYQETDEIDKNLNFKNVEYIESIVEALENNDRTIALVDGNWRDWDYLNGCNRGISDSPVEETTYFDAVDISINALSDEKVTITNPVSFNYYLDLAPNESSKWLHESVNKKNICSQNPAHDFYVSIDVSAKDEYIFESLKTKIEQHRAKKKEDIKPNIITKRQQLTRYKIIPMLDLHILARAKGVNIKHKQVASIVFNNDTNIDTEMIRKYTRNHLKTLFNPFKFSNLDYSLRRGK